MVDHIPFARAPALVDHGLLDYRNPAHVKLWNKATSPLPSKFDLKAEEVSTFLHQFRDRCLMNGWDHITNVPVPPGQQDMFVDLVDNYGQLSLRQVREFAATYVTTPTRASQDSTQAYYCLMGTLTDHAEQVIRLCKPDYMIGDIPAGMPLLKVVMREATVDTNATINMMRTRLSNLSEYMTDVAKFDVPKFNAYVKETRAALQARGEDTTDLQCHLFKAYNVVGDAEFHECIKAKERQFDDGTDVSPDTLMEYAATKYKLLHEKGEWNVPSKEEERIIALRAQVEAQLNELQRQRQKQPNKKKKQDKSKKKQDNPNFARDAPWRFLAPRHGESHTKVVDGKEYHWCTKHKKWVRHTTQACQGRGVRSSNASQDQSESQDQNTSQNSQTDRRLRISRALEAVVEDTEDDE